MKNTNYQRTIMLYGKEVKLWSKQEDIELIELRRAGAEIEEVAEQLNRTQNAISKRLNNRHFYKTYTDTYKKGYRNFLDL